MNTAQIDAGVERMHDRALARYERQVDLADQEHAAYEASPLFEYDLWLMDLPEHQREQDAFNASYEAWLAGGRC